MNDCACSKCRAAATGTPGVVTNRAGLGSIRYRSGEYEDFLAAMIAGLSTASRPALAGLRTRDQDDPTIALLDAWAVTSDVLTFYTERLANESYLRTARERESLQELGKLVAFRLGRGAAAQTFLAFSFERPPVVPIRTPPDPGSGVIPVPGAVTLPERSRVQSVPGPGEVPQTFETVEEIEARPEWNSLTVVRTRPHRPVMDRTELWLKGIALDLRPGSAMLFVGATLDNDRWDLRLLTGVLADTANDRTHISWQHGLGSHSPFSPPAADAGALVLRKRLAVFGHSAPDWNLMSNTVRYSSSAAYLKGRVFVDDQHELDAIRKASAASEWPGFNAVSVVAGGVSVDVEGSHPDIVADSWVVLAQDGSAPYRELYRVVQSVELSRAEFAVSGPITRLTLAGEAHEFGTPRDVRVFAVSESVAIAEAPDPDALESRTIVVDGDAGEMREGRRLALVGESTDGAPFAELATLESVSVSGQRSTLTLQEAPSKPVVRATAAVLGNVALATHGETVTQILGSADARVPFVRFAVQQSPLTFVRADTPRGTESTLDVRVDDVRWKEVASTFAAGPGDRVFTTIDGPDGALEIAFGDGRHGARPATGSNNVRARYRKGTGAAGNVGRNSLTQALDRPLGLSGVSNPAPAEGGVDPEADEHARTSIPIPIRTLGRAVSLSDHADFALAFSGIGKASAVLLPSKAGRTVVVSVADELGLAPPDTVVSHLAAELRRFGDPFVRVVVLPCRVAYFRLALTIRVDPDREQAAVFAAVEAAVRGRYAAPARAIGSGVEWSEVIATAATVPGVVAIDLDRLYRGTPPALRKRLVAAQATASAGGIQAAELLALSPDPFDWRGEMP